MPAYWVARSRIIDPVEYKKYTDLVPGIIARYGGKPLARGGQFQIMEGPDKFHRFIVIEFRGVASPPSTMMVSTSPAPLRRKAAALSYSGEVKQATA